MTDERLLTLAKLAEQASGDLDGGDRLLDVAGLPLSDRQVSAMSFMEQAVRRSDRIDANRLADTVAGRELVEAAETSIASRAVREDDEGAASFLVGVTEQELDGSSILVASNLLEQLRKPEPTFLLGCGNPDAGKTNTVSLMIELQQVVVEDELLVISNLGDWDLCDMHVTNAHDLAVATIEHRNRPKAIFIDEGSTAFDARTKSHEVATQWSPFAKRLAKLQTELVATISHTGKDVLPEFKRLVNLAFLKVDQKTAGFYEEWEGEADHPTQPIFVDDVSALEPTAVEYDPDDQAPWAWNLRGGLFDLGLEWPDLLDELKARGPAE